MAPTQVKVYIKGLTTPTYLSFSLSTKTQTHVTRKTRGVSHCGLAIYIKKYLKAISNISPCKNKCLQKKIL
jgi:hypothetical protein